MDWHEQDDPAAVQPAKKGETAQSPTHVLKLKVPLPTRWSSLYYIIERCCGTRNVPRWFFPPTVHRRDDRWA